MALIAYERPHQIHSSSIHVMNLSTYDIRGLHLQCDHCSVRSRYSVCIANLWEWELKKPHHQQFYKNASTSKTL